VKSFTENRILWLKFGEPFMENRQQSFSEPLTENSINQNAVMECVKCRVE